MTPEDPIATLARAYDDVPYVGRPNPTSHPDHLRVVAALFGVNAAPVPTCRVLELGCGDGANLLPIAATFPGATFVGCDVAERPLALAHDRVRALGLANVRLLHEDFSRLAPDLGAFDYVIAHGLYSWIPPTLRAQLLPSIARHLAPNGIAFVSYNAYPGCHLRQAVWEMLRYHTRSVDGWPARLVAARELIALLADPATADEPVDEAIRTELRAMTERDDSLLGHDDLGEPNDPVYFHQFAADAARSGLAFLAEANLSSIAGPKVTARVRDALAAMDRLTREQYLDFVRLRRYRESLLCHADTAFRSEIDPARIAEMCAYASTRLLASDRGAGEGGASDQAERAVEDLLLARWPLAVPGTELLQWGERHPSLWQDAGESARSGGGAAFRRRIDQSTLSCTGTGRRRGNASDRVRAGPVRGPGLRHRAERLPRGRQRQGTCRAATVGAARRRPRPGGDRLCRRGPLCRPGRRSPARGGVGGAGLDGAAGGLTIGKRGVWAGARRRRLPLGD